MLFRSIRVTRNFINAKIDLLDERIKTAKVIKSSEQTQDQIAFSAKVKLRMSGRAPITIHITGVDEADFSKGNIAFISPLAKALIGMKKGDKKEIELPNGKQNIEIIDIQY